MAFRRYWKGTKFHQSVFEIYCYELVSELFRQLCETSVLSLIEPLASFENSVSTRSKTKGLYPSLKVRTRAMQYSLENRLVNLHKLLARSAILPETLALTTDENRKRAAKRIVNTCLKNNKHFFDLLFS